MNQSGLEFLGIFVMLIIVASGISKISVVLARLASDLEKVRQAIECSEQNEMRASDTATLTALQKQGGAAIDLLKSLAFEMGQANKAVSSTSEHLQEMKNILRSIEANVSVPR